VPAAVEFVDIAGLVKGASQGEGLGNQFLANIRETDAIVHVVRCFDDDDVLHVMGSVDPVRDREVIEFELALADLATGREAASTARAHGQDGRQGGGRRGGRARARARVPQGGARAVGGEAPARAAGGAAAAVAAHREADPVRGERDRRRAHRHEGAHLGALRTRSPASGELAQVVPFSAKIESELAELPPRTGRLPRVARPRERRARPADPRRLRPARLQTYFTAGEQEVRAWTIHRGDTAPKAAGVIHTDFERGFIKADTVAYDAFVAEGGWKGAREKGSVRSEGKGVRGAGRGRDAVQVQRLTTP
jgi:ribosome-binding ATPase YchF (GTP1/OBG family)